MRRVDSIVGREFGRLKVESCEGSRPVGKTRKTFWKCKCRCGKTITVARDSLVGNNTTSCGCFAQENARSWSMTHGKSSTPEYAIWCGIIRRCEAQSCKSYSDYGGRGISMCHRWRNDFTAFLADMGPRPSPKHSVEREDNNGNYEPGNCVWETPIKQGRNKRNNRILSANGESLPLAEWAERLGVVSSVIETRLKRGWSVHDAVLSPRMTRWTRRAMGVT